VPAAICQSRTTIARTARSTKNRSQTFGSLPKKQDGKCWQFAQLFLRHWLIAAASARYANGLCAKCQSQGSRPQVLAKSPGSGEPVYIDGCTTVRTIALKWPIFKQKKGCAAISLGLNCYSMGSFQPPSHSFIWMIIKF
jgi:hypothetical protein